jgi:hypothetical protein
MNKVCVDRKAHKGCAALACNRCKHSVDPAELKKAQKTARYNARMAARAGA